MIDISNRARLKGQVRIDGVRKKVANLRSAETKRNQNLDKVALCKQLVQSNFLEVKSTIERKLEEEKDEALSCLDRIETLLGGEFAIVLQTMEDHLLEEDYLPEHPMSRAAFLHSYLDDRDSLDFFNFENRKIGVDCDPILGVEWECRVLSDGTICNAWLKVGAKQLAMVRTNSISYYVPATERKTLVHLSPPLPNPNCTPWLFLPNGDVFLPGFLVNSINSLQVSIIKPTGQVEHKAFLKTSKHGAGLAYYNGWVFCFGGWNQSVYLASCEKYNLGADSWSPMAAMITPRCHFNALEYQKTVYLFGGDVCACEKFSLLDETFTPMDFKLPEASNTASILYENEILIFTATLVTRFNIKSQQTSFHASSAGRFVIRFSPVIIGQIAYIIHTPHCGGLDGVRQLDLRSFVFKDTISLT